jgi:hypothetical protein
MLFARFLAENGLLVEPSEEAAVSLEELEYYAEQAGRSLWEHAGYCAHRMLLAVFRPEDPALALELPQEHQGKLERLVAELDQATFPATDSLGRTYQFWQADQKETVNKSGNKIGADELSAVTQLFTEDYMVDFLLDNTLGAWWAGRCAAISNDRFEISDCPTEEAARAAVALPSCSWNYLRFVCESGLDEPNLESQILNQKSWRPAARDAGAGAAKEEARGRNAEEQRGRDAEGGAEEADGAGEPALRSLKSHPTSPLCPLPLRASALKSPAAAGGDIL